MIWEGLKFMRNAGIDFFICKADVSVYLSSFTVRKRPTEWKIEVYFFYLSISLPSIQAKKKDGLYLKLISGSVAIMNQILSNWRSIIINVVKPNVRWIEHIFIVKKIN